MIKENKVLATLIRAGLRMKSPRIEEDPESWGLLRHGTHDYSGNVIGLALAASKLGVVMAVSLSDQAADRRPKMRELSERAIEQILGELDLELGECEVLAQAHKHMSATEIANRLDRGDFHLDAA